MYNSVQNPDASPSLAAGLISTAAEQPRWYALQTRPRHEKKVASELQEKGVEIYLPLMAQVRRWSDRRKIVQMPLFPGYAFVRTSFLTNARRAAFYLCGVLGFVSAKDQALPIPDSEIEGIRALLASKVALTPYPFLKVGQRVRLRGGSLDGIEGILLANGEKRLVISVAAIHQSLSINIEGYDVEPI